MKNKEQKKCSKHGVVHKNGGYPSCSTPTERTTKCEHKFSKHPTEIVNSRRGDEKGNNIDVVLSLFKCKKCSFVKDVVFDPFNPANPLFTSPTKPDCNGRDKDCKDKECPNLHGGYYKPDTEEWEVNFGRIASKAWKDKLWHSEATFTTDIKDFIRKEKEKSYQAGIEEQKVLGSEAFETGRHSAYREILEMVEVLLKEQLPEDSMYNDYDNGFLQALSKLKEKLSK